MVVIKNTEKYTQVHYTHSQSNQPPCTTTKEDHTQYNIPKWNYSNHQKKQTGEPFSFVMSQEQFFFFFYKLPLTSQQNLNVNQKTTKSEKFHNNNDT